MGDVSPSRRMLHSPPVAIDGQIAAAASRRAGKTSPRISAVQKEDVQ